MAARNPASVLPEPVGAQISVCRPAAIAGQGVDLVDDDGVDGRQGGAGSFRGQVQVQGFGRGDEEVRGPAEHHLPLP